jgi:hypothetical protein
MADKNEIAFDLEVKGVEQSIESVKDLKNAIKAAKDEQLKAAETFGIASKEFTNASKAVADLKDKVDDLNDATKSVKGSGVESVGESFSQLGEGLRNLDLDKVKTGFNGIGKAMSAVPLILLVQGVQYLVEKFEIFKIIGEAVEQLFYALTDAIGLTNKAAEQQSKDLIAGMKEQEVAVQNRYDAEIKLAKAAGKETADLEIEKLTAIEASVFSQLSVLQNLAEQKGKLNEDELKEYNSLQVELLKATTDKNAAIIADEKAKNEELKKENASFFNSTKSISEQLRKSKLSERELEIEAVKEASAIQLKALDDASSKVVDSEAEYKRMKQAEVDLAQLTANKIAAINTKYYSDAAAKNKAHLDALQAQEADVWFAAQVAEEERKAKEKKDEEQKAIDEQLRLEKLAADQDAQMARYTANKNAEAEIDRKKREEEKALELAKQNEILNFAQMSTQSHQALSDAFFAVKNRNLQKGSAAERKSAEQQFKINKALAIQSAVISGIQGVINALSAQSVVPEPFGTVLKVATAVGVGIAAAANIAKIASTKFDAGGGGGGGGAATLPSAPPIPSPPSISTQQNNTNQSTSFDETGKRIGGENEKQMQPVIQVKATVGVDEVSSKTNRVETLEKQSTF